MMEKQNWQELCALAAKEQDPTKMLKLVQEINRQLDEKERMKQQFSEAS